MLEKLKALIPSKSNINDKNNKDIVKLKWFTGKTKNLAEDYQVTGMQFAFVSKDNEICHQWVLCRDFLHDAVRTALTGAPFNMYGFTYNVKENPIVDLEHMRIAVTKAPSKSGVCAKDTTAISIFENNMTVAKRMLNKLEHILGINPAFYTKIKKVDVTGSSRGAIYLFIGDKLWTSSPIFISLYTFMIRLSENKLDFNTKSELFAELKRLVSQKDRNMDIEYLRSILDNIEFLLKNRSKIIDQSENGFHSMFYSEIDDRSFHHRSGFVSLSRANSSDSKLNKKFHDLLKHERGNSKNGTKS